MANKTGYKYKVVSVEQGFIRVISGNTKQGYKITFIPDGLASEYTVETESLDEKLIDSMIQDKIAMVLTVSNLGG